MDPSSGHHQEMRADDQSLESILSCPKAQQEMMRKPVRPQPEQALKCPRCESTNTKFCYYNNYSLSQPRYFCKSCRRYWTRGGTLRNVPVGGGCRKNKRPSSLSSSSSKRNIIITHQDSQLTSSTTNPLLTTLYDSNPSDLNLPLAFAQLQKLSNGHFGNYGHDQLPMDQGFLEAQRLNVQNLYYGFADGSMGEVTSRVNNQEVMFPCEEVKQELCSGREGEGRYFWSNSQWQINGEETNNLVDFNSSIRGSWNNGFISSSNWQGLINSPLM